MARGCFGSQTSLNLSHMGSDSMCLIKCFHLDHDLLHIAILIQSLATSTTSTKFKKKEIEILNLQSKLTGSGPFGGFKMKSHQTRDFLDGRRITCHSGNHSITLATKDSLRLELQGIPCSLFIFCRKVTFSISNMT